MTSHDDAGPSSEIAIAVKAKIENIRVRLPEHDGIEFQLDLLLVLENQQAALLSLSRSDLLSMIQLVEQASSQSRPSN